MKWFKDYWFLSIVFTILGFIMLVGFPLYLIGYVAEKKLENDSEDDVEVVSEDN